MAPRLPTLRRGKSIGGEGLAALAYRALAVRRGARSREMNFTVDYAQVSELAGVPQVSELAGVALEHAGYAAFIDTSHERAIKQHRKCQCYAKPERHVVARH